MSSFCFRCLMAARTEKTFNNFMRNTRYQMLELEYDLEVMKELYINKEAENKQTLQNNIKELQDKYDGLWRKFRTQNADDEKRMEELFMKRRAFYEEKAAKLEEKIEVLEIKRVEVEHQIRDLKKGKYKEQLAKIEKYEELEAKKNALKNKFLLKNLFKSEKEK